MARVVGGTRHNVPPGGVLDVVVGDRVARYKPLQMGLRVVLLVPVPVLPYDLDDRTWVGSLEALHGAVVGGDLGTQSVLAGLLSGGFGASSHHAVVLDGLLAVGVEVDLFEGRVVEVEFGACHEFAYSPVGLPDVLELEASEVFES